MLVCPDIAQETSNEVTEENILEQSDGESLEGDILEQGDGGTNEDNIPEKGVGEDLIIVTFDSDGSAASQAVETENVPNEEHDSNLLVTESCVQNIREGLKMVDLEHLVDLFEAEKIDIEILKI